MRQASFYEWIGKMVSVRLPDGYVVEGILLAVDVPWIVIHEFGVPRHVYFEAGVVVESVFDRENPYWQGRERARRDLVAKQAARRRTGEAEE